MRSETNICYYAATSTAVLSWDQRLRIAVDAAQGLEANKHNFSSKFMIFTFFLLIDILC